MCPGKKEYVSIKVDGVFKGTETEKLVNLKEMYENFRKDNPENKIGFSKFCELRPRWCIAHSLCL